MFCNSKDSKVIISNECIEIIVLSSTSNSPTAGPSTLSLIFALVIGIGLTILSILLGMHATFGVFELEAGGGLLVLVDATHG